MNLNEAYSILELSESATPEEAKKKYRELTKIWHPDINKEPGAEDKFKKINEAYGCVQSGKGTDREEQPQGNPFADIFGRQRRQRPFNPPQQIMIETTVSFKDSILGCKRDVSFNRKTKCPECNGQGEQQINNGCSKCHGLGVFTQQHGNMIFSQTCDKCGGRTQSQPCSKCNTTGSVDADVSIQVQIPGGVKEGNILRLGGMGNFAGVFMGAEQYMDAHLIIHVTPSDNLKLEGDYVVSSVSISLLEALVGCNKSVETIMGMRGISINPKSKNKDEVIVPNLGVNGKGSQKVIINIEYPDDITSLIETLSKIDLTA